MKCLIGPLFWKVVFAVNVCTMFVSGAMVVRAQYLPPPDEYGGEIQKGCKTCQNQDKTILECYYNYIANNKIIDPPKFDCSPDACQTRFLQYCICQSNAADKEKVDNCDMVEKKTWLRERQDVFKNKGAALKCGDNTWAVISGKFGLPALAAPCIPYLGGEFKGRCTLDSCDKGVMVGSNMASGVWICK